MFHNIIVYHSTLTVVLVGFVRIISRHLRTLIKISNSSKSITPSVLLLIQLSISFKKKRHKILLMGSPCFTPVYELMKFEVADLYRINDLTVEYIDLMAWMNLVLIPSAKSFYHRYILFLLSNIFPSQEKQDLLKMSLSF